MISLFIPLLASATALPTTTPAVTDALSASLRISGIALVAIFFVMGLFGLMITLIGRLFPESEDP